MTAHRPLAVGITPVETRRDVMVRVAVRAEQLGYAAVAVAEGWGQDVSVVLTEIALSTSRIQIGTGVLNVWGRSPAGIAMLATSLADVSGGRFALGLGAGSPQLAEGLHDVPFHAPVARLGAVTRQVRSLLEGGRISPSFPGGSRPLRLGVRPPAPISINLAALGPQSVRLTGELADGWYPFLLPVSGLKDGVRLLEEGAARAGSERPLPRICPVVPVAVAPDPARARAMATWWITFYLTSMGPLYARTLRRHGFGDAVDAVLEAARAAGAAGAADAFELPPAAQVLIDELVISGNESTARADLERWYQAGADLTTIVLPPNRSLEELEHILDVLRPA
jgi:alkanesulfonate monooxygenase SsuD/methylene tetrahydromethanopterin reductase-like flavin-dependent oxidoreductase (luciferase family)